MIPLHISDLYDKIKKEKLTGGKLVDFLIDNNTEFLQDVLYHTYHPDLQFSVKKIPDYRPSRLPNGQGMISLEYVLRKLSPYQGEITPKIEGNLIQVLESLSNTEAEILAGVLMKNLEHIPIAAVKKAFPGLLK